MDEHLICETDQKGVKKMHCQIHHICFKGEGDEIWKIVIKKLTKN